MNELKMLRDHTEESYPRFLDLHAYFFAELIKLTLSVISIAVSRTIHES